MRGALWCVALVGLALASCSAVQTLPEQRVALLQILCQPADVEISIDEEPMGELLRWRQHTLPLRPGARRVEISREGYYPYLMDLQAEPGRQYTLTLELVPRPWTLEEDAPAPPPPSLELEPPPASPPPGSPP